jgi:hypothetical protein
MINLRYQLLMWCWPVNEMIKVVSGMLAPQFGDEGSSVSFYKMFSHTHGDTRTPGWRPLVYSTVSSCSIIISAALVQRDCDIPEAPLRCVAWNKIIVHCFNWSSLEWMLWQLTMLRDKAIAVTWMPIGYESTRLQGFTANQQADGSEVVSLAACRIVPQPTATAYLLSSLAPKDELRVP